MYIEWRNNAVSRDIVTRWTSQETKPITKTISQTQHYAGCHTGYQADHYAGYHADNHADYYADFYAGYHEGHHAYYHTGYHEDYHEGDHVDYHAGYYTGYNLDWQQNEMIITKQNGTYICTQLQVEVEASEERVGPTVSPDV